LASSAACTAARARPSALSAAAARTPPRAPRRHSRRRTRARWRPASELVASMAPATRKQARARPIQLLQRSLETGDGVAGIGLVVVARMPDTMQCGSDIPKVTNYFDMLRPALAFSAKKRAFEATLAVRPRSCGTTEWAAPDQSSNTCQQVGDEDDRACASPNAPPRRLHRRVLFEGRRFDRLRRGRPRRHQLGQTLDERTKLGL